MVVEGREFFDPLGDDSEFPWEPVEGFPEGIYEKILYLDEADGSHSRILTIDAGVVVEDAMTHDLYEEVLILEGGMIDRATDDVYTAIDYAYHPPGMEHGPYEFPIGALMFEARYHR